jgi:putative SOS response-associated peptidase YedK
MGQKTRVADTLSVGALKTTGRAPQGNWLRTFTIVTGEPNGLVAPIHNRMPVILRPQDYGIWLSESPADTEALSAACAPFPAEEMRAYPISTRIM